jgi:Mechanosensitive ion channel, conserved TM helix
MGENLSRHIGDAFYRLMEAFLAVIPAVLVLVVSLGIGILVGLLVKALLKGIFRLTRFGEKKSPGASGEILKAAGVRAHPAQVASAISFWAAVVVALVVGVDALEPSGLKNALEEAVAFLPRVLTAALLLVLGLGLATLARRSILLAAVNAGLPWARTGARLVHVIVLVFFGATALDHLGVARSILVAAFSILAGGLVLAVSLAFGLGARDLARGYLEKRLRAEEEDSGIRHV